MNVFILSTGRCGSMALARACDHITNFTSGHETRRELVGPARLDYPDQHIESDNRLAWYAGRMEEKFGDDAFYLHLKRDRQRVVESYARRDERGLMLAFRELLMQEHTEPVAALDLSREACETVDTNIEFYLRDKSKVMTADIADGAVWFPEFWERIGAEGDLEAALREFEVRHNASPDLDARQRLPFFVRLFRKGKRVVAKAPQFILEA